MCGTGSSSTQAPSDTSNQAGKGLPICQLHLPPPSQAAAVPNVGRLAGPSRLTTAWATAWSLSWRESRAQGSSMTPCLMVLLSGSGPTTPWAEKCSSRRTPCRCGTKTGSTSDILVLNKETSHVRTSSCTRRGAGRHAGAPTGLKAAPYPARALMTSLATSSLDCGF